MRRTRGKQQDLETARLIRRVTGPPLPLTTAAADHSGPVGGQDRASGDWAPFGLLDYTEFGETWRLK